MTFRNRYVSGALAAALACAAPAAAQRASRIGVTRGDVEVTPYAGYLVSERLVDGDRGFDFGTTEGPVYGAQLALPLAPQGSIVGSVAYSPSELRIGLPILGGIDFGDSKTWIFDLGVHAGVPIRSLGLTPFVELGGGAIHRELSWGGYSVDGTDWQVSVGAGADVALLRGVALRLSAKDYVGKADFGEVGSFRARTDDLHNLAITAGVRVAL